MMGRMWLACIVAGALLGGCSSAPPPPAPPPAHNPTAEEERVKVHTEWTREAIGKMRQRLAMHQALKSDTRPPINWRKQLSDALTRSGHKSEEAGLLAAMEKECVAEKVPDKIDAAGLDPELVKTYQETRKEYDPLSAELDKMALEAERWKWLRLRSEAYGSNMPEAMRVRYLTPDSGLEGCVPMWVPAGFHCRDIGSSPKFGNRVTVTGPGKAMCTIVTSSTKLTDEISDKWKSDKEYPVKELEAPLRHFPKSVAGADRLQLISEKRGIRFDAIDMKPEDALKVIANM